MGEDIRNLAWKLSGLLVPSVAVVGLLLSLRHLSSSDPIVWRGGDPMSPLTLVALVVLFLMIPIWLGRKDHIAFPFHVRPELLEQAKFVLILGSEIVFMASALIAAYGQAQILNG